MSVDHATVVFFDASSLIAAAGSPQGGSGFLLSLCQRELLTGAVSDAVLVEAERNVMNKLGPVALATYDQLVEQTALNIMPVPAPPQLATWPSINAKDRPVVASAVAAQASFLITLDRGLITQANQTNLPVTVLTPEQFIKSVLPDHVDYPRLRP